MPALPANFPRHALMGIVNVTPNSFSDTGVFLAPDAAAVHARALAAAGAAVLDLGAEASSFFRAGVEPVDAPTQLERLLPALERIRDLPTLISIDTRSARVAREAVAAGARIINDISAGTHDPDMLPTVAQLGVPIILMHCSPAFPATPAQDDPDIVEKVAEHLRARAAAAISAGIQRSNILVDPGLGFGITPADCWRIVAGLSRIAPEFPLVLGASRKRFLETPPPQDVQVVFNEKTPLLPPLEPKTEHPRDPATAQVTLFAAQTAPNVRLHRVHNVALVARALRDCGV